MDVDFGIRHCPQCGVAYGPYWEDDEGLCPACERLEQLREAAKIKRKPKMKPPTIIECAICKKQFEKRGTTDKYCDDCKHSALRKKQREYEKRKREEEAKKKKVVLLQPVHLEEGSDPRDAWMPERPDPQKKRPVARLKCSVGRLPKPMLAPTKGVRIGEVTPYTEGFKPYKEENPVTGAFSKEEDETIMEMLGRRETYSDIARALGRTPGSLAAHAKYLEREDKNEQTRDQERNRRCGQSKKIPGIHAPV